MKTTLKLLLLPIVTAFTIFLTGCGGEEDPHHDHDGHDHSAATDESAAGDAGYPLTTCVVSGESLGSMGIPVKVVHDGTTVKLCCKSCIDDFNATPEVFVDKLKVGS